YYARMERGELAGVSAEVLDSVARALRLDEAEQDHLADLARAAGPRPMRRRRRTSEKDVTPAFQRFLDAVTGAPVWVRDRRMDFVAANALGRALYAPLFEDPSGRANTARFTFLDPAARLFFPDWEANADGIVATMRTYAGQNPLDKGLTDLIRELGTRRAASRQRRRPAALVRARRAPPPRRAEADPPSRGGRSRAQLRGDGPALEPGVVHVRVHRGARQPQRGADPAARQPRRHRPGGLPQEHD